MRTSNLLLIGLAAPLIAVAADVPPPADQIALAVLAAPQEAQAGAGVWGFDENRKLVRLREPTNEFVCFGDAPFVKGIDINCSPKAVEYWMVRVWQLRSQGKRPSATLGPEVESGKAQAAT